MSELLAKRLGRNLRKVRVARRLSQDALAANSGYSEGYIRRIELGHQRNPTLGFVDAVATAIGIPPEELLR